ncbi:carbohydrate kinase family protein [Sulfitobacter guttiformis]|uniref:Fructokinase n=1 Tax=Sulfitobacter guttiformis TaxID=74349 RepID=A0A420DUS1_9RHOB|nr:carbohydrate kinase [Sulfitobacter guttiformis]KIN71496.1 PfkB protein [Sulfitobacter guttiformis KCTC 32187]RKE97923.1 fructokinase [Sulfitobacter guttiformis]
MILCCGEALIDMIPTPTATGQNGFVPHTGGAIFNTAIALGRLGVKAGMLTGLSQDMFGQQLLTALQDSHVDTSHIITADRPSTLAFVKLVEGHATYSFFDENSAGRMIGLEDMPSLHNEVSTLFFGGISLVCEPCAEAYTALLVQEADSRVIMVDPNIRESFIIDKARYRDRLDRVIRRADIIKVSDEDLDWIAPAPSDLDAKAHALLDKGASMVIVTRGSKGANGYLANGIRVSVPATKAVIVDTVGAGDTFNAGVLAKLSMLGLLKKPDLTTLDAATFETVLRYGAMVAAVTVSRAGANPPWEAELLP